MSGHDNCSIAHCILEVRVRIRQRALRRRIEEQKNNTRATNHSMPHFSHVRHQLPQRSTFAHAHMRIANVLFSQALGVGIHLPCAYPRRFAVSFSVT
eukprot:scaffold224944_cov31-Tisochrysis_lutea.AAC.1